MKSRDSSLVLVIVWFGPLPFWMPAFLLSCRHNPGVEWRIFSDVIPPSNLPENVKFLSMDMETFNRRATDALGFRVHVTPAYAYKMCDLKIMYGRIFEKELRGFDFWGCCDMDIVWGNIRSFITPEVLENYDVITSRVGRISGHFCLFRNQSKWLELFRWIPDVKELVEQSDQCMRIDENLLTELLQRWTSGWVRRVWARYVQHLPVPRIYWGRELTTRGRQQRLMLDDSTLSLRWRNGRTYNVHGEEIMYLHFHEIRKGMKGIDFGYGDSPEEFTVSPVGLVFREGACQDG